MTSVIEDENPVYVGDTASIFAPVFLHRDKTPEDLSGCTITMKLEMYADDYESGVAVGTVKTCSGTWTIDDATNGKAHYQYQSGDVDTPGVWNRWITITNADNKPKHADDGQGNPKRLTIKPVK